MPCILRRAGYDVLEASSGEQGLKIFEEHQGKILAVLLDFTLPGLDGGEVVQRLRAIKAGVKIILSSGALAPSALEGQQLIYLNKPYLPADLVRAVSQPES